MAKETYKIKYAKSEKFIKAYRYCSSNIKESGGVEIEKNVTITTERLIVEENSKHGFTRDEIAISNINRVESNWQDYKKASMGYLWIVLGIISIVFSFLGKRFINQYYLIPLIFGILLFFWGLILIIRRKPQLSFLLQVYSTNPIYQQAMLTETNFSVKVKKSRRKKNKNVSNKIVVKVTPAALVMLNEIGAIIIDVKHYNEQTKKLLDLYNKKIIDEIEYNEKINGLFLKLVENIKE